MANKQPRSLGALARFEATGAISDLPGTAVESGGAFAALERLGGTLSARLKVMADRAASSEGEMAGLSAGARAGAKFVEKGDLAARGEARARGKGKTPGVPAVRAGEPAGAAEVPLQLRRDNTIRGDAFDAAAIKTYGWRLQTGIATDLMAAYDANPANPGGYDAAAAAVRDKYLKDATLGDPVLREIFDRQFLERTAAQRLAVASAHQAQVLAEHRAAASEGIATQAAELERQAYVLGANPAANWMMGGQLKRAAAAIDAEVEDGTFSPAQGKKFKTALQQTVFAARTEGTFDALPTPQQKQDFALSIMDDYAKGDGPFADISLSEAKNLSGELYRRAAAEQNLLTAQSKGEAARLEGVIADDLASIAATGQGLDPEDAGLSVESVKTLLGEDGVIAWQDGRALAQQGWEATAGMELETPQELNQRLVALQPEPGSANFKARQGIFEAAQKQAQAILTERETDPLGQAQRGKLVELKPIDTTSAETLTTSLQLRRQQAQMVADAYGTPVTVFRPSERTALAQGLLDNPALLPGFAASVGDTFGDMAPQALSELSEAGPELAQAAGIMLATGNSSVAQDVAFVLAARRDKELKVNMPGDGVLATAAGGILGPALGEAPEARAAAIGVANLLFEREANALGFDPGDVDEDGSQAQAAYQRALNRALGGQTVNGVNWGGLADVNGSTIVAPSFMPADMPQALLGSLADEDLQLLPPLLTGNGVPIRAAELRGAQLVTIGDGQYRVALGDPNSFDPQYVLGADGDFWLLDMQQLQDAHRARKVQIFVPTGAPRIGAFPK